MKLVIAEKPSVARSIAKVIGADNQKDGYLTGDEYVVSWCVGHLVGLADAVSYSEAYAKWDYEDLPIIPEPWKYEIMEQTKSQFFLLKKLLNDTRISEVVCATDAGREGELIFRLVYEMAGCTKPIKRLWISSMEDEAIRKGFEELADGSEYQALYESALARAMADWLVGINATRLFSILYRKTLNIGRVQTPTLAMMVQREEAIRVFQPEPFFHVHIKSGGLDAVSERIANREAAVQLQQACLNGQAFVVSVEKEEKKTHPPKLYDLTTLQREANRIFGYTAKQTLDITQSLYEKKIVTYPRTDSCYLTDDMGMTAKKIIALVQSRMRFAKGYHYEPDVNRVLNSSKVSDHHAIIPTAECGSADLSQLSGNEENILSLISYKLLCATGQTEIVEHTKAVIDCNGRMFTATGKVVKDAGYTALEQPFLLAMNGKVPEKKEQYLPSIGEGEILSGFKTEITDHKTTPPKHFTEDSLLAAMERAGAEEMDEDVERKGLGTPATRAGIIERLVKSGFVERKNKQMLPTRDGINLIAVLPEPLTSPQMTAEWENQLTQIAKGLEQADSFIYGIENMVQSLVTAYHEVGEENKNRFASERKVYGICPRCGKNVVANSKGYVCEGGRACGFAIWKKNKFLANAKKTLTDTMVEELLESGRTMVKGLYSPKKDKNYNAYLKLKDDGEYVGFELEFPQTKKGGRK